LLFSITGFEPDLITFGKGMGIAGMATHKTLSHIFSFNKWHQTTEQADAFRLIRSAYICKVIVEQRLLQVS
jgi:4-aminobutyrate aminotransferase-like enzyme